MVGRLGDRLAEGDDRVGDADLGAAHKVVLQVLQANLEVQFARAGNDVLARLLDGALDHGVRLGQAFQALDQLGQVGRDLGLNGDADDGRDGELHGLDRVRVLALLARERRVFGDELVQADHGDRVAAGDVLDRLLAPAHAQDGALHGLDVQVLLGAGHVVGAHDANFRAGADLAGEDAAKREEPALVLGRDHLGHVQHERAIGVAGADGVGVHVVERALVQGLDTVDLGRRGRGQVVDHHLQQRLVRGQPGLHDALHERLARQLAVVGFNLGGDAQLVAQVEQLGLVVVDGG